MSLIQDQFEKDERVKSALKTLQRCYEEYQSQLKGVKAADEDKKVAYDALIKDYSELRGGKLWYPYLGSGMGSGALVELADGSVKYDMISGIGVHWGHGQPELIEANLNAACQDIVMQGNLQQNINATKVAKLFTDLSGMDHCYLTTSGAMAAENGLKMIFQKQFPADRILAFRKCFIGRTLALSQVTDKDAYRQGLPPSMKVDYVPFYDANDPEGSTQESLRRLKTYVERYPEQHAVFCAELIQGEGGYFTATPEYFKTIFSYLKDQNIPILIDEIQTFGRTPGVFAFKEYGLEAYPDVVTVGKLTQLCATLYKKEFKPKPGLISQTFTASTSAIEASRVILEALSSDKYAGPEGRIAKRAAYFKSKLEALSQAHPDLVKGPFGYGLMLAFTPADGDPEKVLAFTHKLFEAGVISFVAGTKPKRVRFLPPVGAVTEKDIDAVIEIVEATLLAHFS